MKAQSGATDTTLDTEAYRARYGRVEIEISCAESAVVHFERGLLLMHTFAWSDARDSFRDAAQADPGCAMAHWGEAMGYYDGLHAHPSAEEVAEAREALARIIDFSRDDLKLARLSATTTPANTRVHRLLEGLGFSPYSRHPDHTNFELDLERFGTAT